MKSLIFIAGANPAVAHPIVFRAIEDARAANPDLKIIVVDPRRTTTAEKADLFLQIKPGTDLALLNGLLPHGLTAFEISEIEAELRNFRMTAERLFTTQAAVSSRIATLEQEFGVRLFDRGVREVTLTADGAKALVHAERMLRLMREMREDMLDKQAYAGVIRIGAIESIVHSWFPDFLALLQQRYPRLQVEIACDTTIHMSEQLLKGQLDVSL